MRIGINANYFQKSSTGIGVVTEQFMRTLAKVPEQAAHEWIWYYEGEVPSGKWPENWQFRRVTTFWKRDDIPHRYIWERFALPKAVKQDQCEVFLSLYQSATVLPAAVRHAMFVHDLIPRRFPEYLSNSRQRWYYSSIEQGIARAHQILVPSQATKNDIVEFLHLRADSIRLVPLGLDEKFTVAVELEKQKEVLSQYGLAPGYIYHGGGLERRKNTEMVLRAYQSLLSQSDGLSVPKLVISGRVHPETNPLATPVLSLIASLALESDVKLLGWVPDEHLPVLYQAASVFVFPSKYEGFGLPVLEAFASGTPVITTSAGSLAELAMGKAELVPIEGTNELVSALRLVLSDPAERARLRLAGKERSKDFRWDVFASTVLQALLP